NKSTEPCGFSWRHGLIPLMPQRPHSGGLRALRRSISVGVGYEGIEATAETSSRRQGGAGGGRLPRDGPPTAAIVALVDPVDAPEQRQQQNPSKHRSSSLLPRPSRPP